MADLRNLIEEEVFAIRHSGEMPEVAFHTSLHYLQEDPEGPRLTVTPEDMQPLKEAVEMRYKRIVMRDLNPRYRDRSIYRGLARAIANWQRLVRFCQREKRDIALHRQDVATALVAFLTIETGRRRLRQETVFRQLLGHRTGRIHGNPRTGPIPAARRLAVVCPEGSDMHLTP
jgi:hypothetical protein